MKTMKNIGISVCLGLFVLVMVPVAYAGASLWLFPHSSIELALTDQYFTDPDYVEEDDNPYFVDSYVVGSGLFLLDIYNYCTFFSPHIPTTHIFLQNNAIMPVFYSLHFQQN